MRTTRLRASCVPVGSTIGRSSPPFSESFQLFSTIPRCTRHRMGENDFVAYEFLRCVPIAFGHRGRETFLIDIAATQANILGVMHVAKNIGEEMLVGFDRFLGAVRYRSCDETGDVDILSRFAALLSAGGDIFGALANITGAHPADSRTPSPISPPNCSMRERTAVTYILIGAAGKNPILAPLI